MNNPDASISDDYAILHCKNASFYYGYEHVINDEWCFVASFNDEDIIIPFSKLGCDDMFQTGDCLLAGIGWILAKYKLVLK